MTAPSLYVYQNGLSQVSGDELNTFNQTCNVVNDLRGFIGTAGIMVYLRGYTAINDGGQGQFYWNASGTGPDDAGVTTVVPNGAAVGCWSRSQVTTQQVLGATTSTNAVVGYLGEYENSYVTSSAPVSVLNSTATNLTNLVLTKGDWDVYSQATIAVSGGHTLTLLYSDINTTSATFDLNNFGVTTWLGSWAGDGSSIISLSGSRRFFLSATTTIYHIVQQASGASQNMWGGLWARRAR